MKLQNAATQLHVAVYRLTGGKVGARVGRTQMLILTTTGRRSGLKRDVPLGYGRDGEHFFLIASNGGAVDHPAWYKNLRANPEAKIQVGSKVISVRAHDAGPADRDRLWKDMTTKHYKGYDQYQKKTKREIPVVVLEPTH